MKNFFKRKPAPVANDLTVPRRRGAVRGSSRPPVEVETTWVKQPYSVGKFSDVKQHGGDFKKRR